jgi:type VI secretion system protein ImpG
MEDDILNYYERELTFIREMGAEFARKYPKIAGRLLLEPDKCEDPHTERLIEAFAFLSGRIHKKIDDDFPEITESLLNILYPHYINPIPSMSVATFEPIKQAVPPAGYHIVKNTTLYSKPINGVPCQFVTTYPVTLWPVEVISAGLRDPKKTVKNAQQAVVIQLKTANRLSCSQLGWESLRFFLNGPGQHIHHLYELLCNNVCHVECEATNRQGRMETVPLTPEDIRPVGFHPDECILPFPERSFPGYQLLFEYFCVPDKFLFLDLHGLGAIRRREVNDTLDIWIYLNRTTKPNLLIDKSTFSLNSTPVVNLFNRIAEPIRVEEVKTEYHVIPDIRRTGATEIFSIDSIVAAAPDDSEKARELRPFYSLKHHLDDADDLEHQAFWHVRRRPSGKKGDDGTEVFLCFSDMKFRPRGPDTETVTVRINCTNRDLPGRLPFGDPAGDFEMETAAPVARISCIVKPTPTRRPSLGGALQWRLISHLSLNYLSLVQGGGEALKEILKLYDFDNSPSTRQQINGIVSLQPRHITRRIGQSFCRGVQVTIEFDEDKFVGTGLYLFASVLESFLGQYVSLNSFSQLAAKTTQKKEGLKTWPPRSGNRILL